MGTSLVLVLGGLAGLVADTADEKVKAELKKLDGTWVHLTTEREGEKKPEPRTIWVIKDGKAAVHFSNRPAATPVKDWTFQPTPTNKLLTYHLKLDPSQSPKALDKSTAYNGEDKPSTQPEPAIYKLDGDTLTLCVAGYADKGKRPAEFSAPKGSGRRVYVMKREKS